MTTDAELSHSPTFPLDRRLRGLGDGGDAPRPTPGGPKEDDRDVLPAEPSNRPPLAPRLASLLLLAALTIGLVALAATILRVFTDAWVGPAHLSPDNDQVLQSKLRLNQQLAEMARVEAEVARIDEELGALDTAEDRLQALRANAFEALTWTGEAESRLARTLASSVRRMEEQLRLLEELRARQAEVLSDAEAAAAAGLSTSRDVERERTALMRLDLNLAADRRQLEETRVKAVEARERAEAMRRGTTASVPRRGASPEHGEVPEVVAREEQEVRVELELVRLNAERRGLRALRRAAVEGLERSRKLLDEIKGRPVFRAMEAQTDVAFVPYAHLDKIAPGHDVVRCVWGVFWCTPVGKIAEILPGEVATQDPWGELARGRYAILELDDPIAIQEQTLRVRAP